MAETQENLYSTYLNPSLLLKIDHSFQHNYNCPHFYHFSSGILNQMPFELRQVYEVKWQQADGKPIRFRDEDVSKPEKKRSKAHCFHLAR